jgi:hypothetical protein
VPWGKKSLRSPSEPPPSWSSGHRRLIIDQIAQATRTALAERAYQQMLIEAVSNPPSIQITKNSDGPSEPTLLFGRRS